MKNYTITEEQIKKLSTQDQIVEEYLNEWFPDAFRPKIEVGKWYTLKKDNDEILVHITSLENNYSSYGFTYDGIYFINEHLGWTYMDHPQNWRLATEGEVKTALLKEAKKLGFKEGVKFKSASSGDIFIAKEENSLVLFQEMKTLSYSMGCIFNNGKWAEIIQSKYLTKEQAEKRLAELNNDGYEYEIID